MLLKLFARGKSVAVASSEYRTGIEHEHEHEHEHGGQADKLPLNLPHVRRYLFQDESTGRGRGDATSRSLVRH